MATISSHILDTVSGASAIGIRAELFKIDGDARQRLFEVNANEEGRVLEEVDIGTDSSSTEYELVFYAADYFLAAGRPAPAYQKVVVLRFSMPDKSRKYHMPIMLSPHSYSVWWSA
jgi:5-hydroxyisourate hydrolase